MNDWIIIVKYSLIFYQLNKIGSCITNTLRSYVFLNFNDLIFINLLFYKWVPDGQTSTHVIVCGLKTFPVTHFLHTLLLYVQSSHPLIWLQVHLPLAKVSSIY